MTPAKEKGCRHCQARAQLLRLGQDGYPYRRDYGPMWVCVPCQAWVGCHPGTTNPLGGLAKADGRAAKMAAHEVFDALWKRKMAKEGCSKSAARKAGYRWLAGQLGIPFEKCHIGYMSVEECQRVVEICTQAKKRPNKEPTV